MNEYVTVTEAARLLPGRPHRNTARRYMLKGVGGIKLRSIKLGATGNRFTTREWVDEFLTPLPPNKATTAHTRKRKQGSERVGRGIVTHTGRLSRNACNRQTQILISSPQILMHSTQWVDPARLVQHPINCAFSHPSGRSGRSGRSGQRKQQPRAIGRYHSIGLNTKRR